MIQIKMNKAIRDEYDFFFGIYQQYLMIIVQKLKLQVALLMLIMLLDYLNQFFKVYIFIGISFLNVINI
jgi:hypothetical protein